MSAAAQSGDDGAAAGPPRRSAGAESSAPRRRERNASVSGPKTRIRVATLNACILPAYLRNVGVFGSDDKDARIARMAALAGDAGIDVLLLQELWDANWSGWSPTDRAREILADFGFGHFAAFKPRCCALPVGTGNAVASRFPLRDASMHVFRAAGGAQALVPNGVVHASVDLSRAGVREPLHVFSTHIHTGPAESRVLNGPERCIRVQAAQCAEVADFVRAEAGAEPYVVGGDFNSDARASFTGASLLPYARLCDIMRRPSLLAGAGFPSTYPFPNVGGPASYLVNPAFFGEETCVDHVFTSLGGGAVAGVDVVEPFFRGEVVSDHAMVVATLEL